MIRQYLKLSSLYDRAAKRVQTNKIKFLNPSTMKKEYKKR